MKTLNKFLFLALITGFVACGAPKEEAQEETNSESTENVEEAADLAGMEEVSLADYQMESSISLPMDRKPDIVATDWGSIEIRIGDKFGIEILPAGISVAEHKEELASDLVYNIEYLEDSENLVVYKKSIEGSDIDAEHHFFMNFEADGELYEIKSLADMSFKKPQVDKMVNSAKSFKLN